MPQRKSFPNCEPPPGGGFCSCGAGGSPGTVSLRPCFRGVGCCGAVRAAPVHAGHFRRRQRAPDDRGACPAASCAGRRAYDRLRGVHARHDAARTPCLPGEALCAEDRLAGTVARLPVFPQQYAGGTGRHDPQHLYRLLLLRDVHRPRRGAPADRARHHAVSLRAQFRLAVPVRLPGRAPGVGLASSPSGLPTAIRPTMPASRFRPPPAKRC